MRGLPLFAAGMSGEKSLPEETACSGFLFRSLCLRIVVNTMINEQFEVAFKAMAFYRTLENARDERSSTIDRLVRANEKAFLRQTKDAIQRDALAGSLTAEMEDCQEKGMARSKLLARLVSLRDPFAIDDDEGQILLQLAYLRLDARLRRFSDFVYSAYGDIGFRPGYSSLFVLAVLTNRQPATLESYLGRRGSLVEKGLVVTASAGRDMAVRLSDVVEGIVLSPEMDETAVLRILLGEEGGDARFGLSDFPQVGDPSSLAILLRNALELPSEKRLGVNVLLTGPLGSGKTEFVRALCKAVDAQPCFAARPDPEAAGETAHAGDRLARFHMSRHLARRLGKVVMVVDDAEEIFRAVPWKANVERLLDANDVPTIWVTSEPKALNPHAVRRMIDVVEFGKVGRAVRRDIAARLLKDEGLAWSEPDVERMVDLDASAALMERGIRSSALSTRKVEKAVATVVAIEKRLGRRRAPEPIKSRFRYDLSLVRTDVDLAEIAAKAVAAGRDKALSFCLHGMPGTGKTAFCLHLAKLLDMPVLEKRASDLLDKYLGEAEKHIAEAFEEARSEGAFLVLNEADTFLRDRRFAEKSWEVSIVNEVLTWTESHPLPFAMTTNLMDSLDAAALRRFLFKIRFDDMDGDQVEAAFRNAFGMEPPADMREMRMLTPGDFALVSRRCDVLGTTDPEAIAGMLLAEVEAKAVKGLVPASLRAPVRIAAE